MKKVNLFICIILSIFLYIENLKGQVTIGSGNAPKSFSILELDASGTKGGLRLPQITTAERNTIAVSGEALASGLMIYNTTTNLIEYWDGTNWVGVAEVEPWMVAGGTAKATSNTQDIYQTGSVGIGIANPLNKLHVFALSDPMRVQGLQSGLLSDSLVSVNGTGVVRRRSVYSLRKDIVAEPTVGETPFKGMIRFNTTTNLLEYYNGTVWASATEVEPWMVSGTTTKATSNAQDIYQIGAVGIGVSVPTNKLHVSAVSNPARIEGLQGGERADSLVSVNGTGVVRRRSVYSLRKDIVAEPAVGETPFKGMIKFNTTTNFLEYWDGTQWAAISSNIFGGRNEGIVRIDGSSGNTNTKPTYSFTNPELNTFKYIDYVTPLARPFAYWPENITSPTDANIVGTTASHTTYIENPILGQVHTWRIIGSYSGKSSGATGSITIRMVNPASTFILQQSAPLQAQTTTSQFTLIFITVADTVSLPSPIGTGNGYQLLVSTDAPLTVSITSVTRISNYKD